MDLKTLARRGPRAAALFLETSWVQRSEFTWASIHYTVEPLYNGQVGAGAFVHYLEVSFIGRCGCGLSLKIDDAI